MMMRGMIKLFKKAGSIFLTFFLHTYIKSKVGEFTSQEKIHVMNVGVEQHHHDKLHETEDNGSVGES